MKKSSLFISAVLTSFVLVVLVGVVTAYQSFTGGTTQAAVQQSVPTAQVSAPAAVVPQAAVVMPQAAAQIAAQFIGRTDLYSADTVPLNGSSAYKVTFSSGDIVYVSLQGQVLNVVPASSSIANSNPPALVQPSFTAGYEHDGGHGD